jgi:hypothetical protein
LELARRDREEFADPAEVESELRYLANVLTEK